MSNPSAGPILDNELEINPLSLEEVPILSTRSWNSGFVSARVQKSGRR